MRLSFRGVGERLALIKVERAIREFCDAVGEKRFEWMVAHSRPLRVFVTPELQKVINVAPQYGWVGGSISDEQFVAMLPPWVHQIIARYGEEGRVWLRETIAWLRSLFLPTETAPDKGVEHVNREG